jgi:aryl-alcohol dehydrogenase-like predicted oxidoreductase
MRYRIFGRTGLRVSSQALGTGNFGTGWGYGAERGQAKAIYDAYRAAGGNFVDTADQYQFGQSETLLGEFVAAERDDVVLATKASMGDSPGAGLQGTGNSRKAITQSLEKSLKRLGTDRVDLLWVHMPDQVTPTDELARTLEDLVRSGKALHVGLSDFPAWRAARAATIAELRGWSGVCAIQLEYSLVERTSEAELLPMAEGFDLGVVAWSPLGGGLLTGKYRLGETGRKEGLGVVIHDEEGDARKIAALDAVLAVAQEAGVSPGAVAIAWVLAKGVLPILGPRTPEQLAGNLVAGDVTLSPEQIARLDAASAPPTIFPQGMIANPGNRQVLAGGIPDQIDARGRPLL